MLGQSIHHPVYTHTHTHTHTLTHTHKHAHKHAGAHTHTHTHTHTALYRELSPQRPEPKQTNPLNYPLSLRGLNKRWCQTETTHTHTHTHTHKQWCQGRSVVGFSPGCDFHNVIHSEYNVSIQSPPQQCVQHYTPPLILYWGKDGLQREIFLSTRAYICYWLQEKHTKNTEGHTNSIYISFSSLSKCPDLSFYYFVSVFGVVMKFDLMF